MKEKAVVVSEVQEAVVIGEYQRQQQSVEAMIISAIKSGLPVETMERILSMRTQLKQENAKEQFIQAMANFQAQCPVIKKTKDIKEKGGGKTRSSYAPIDSIVAQVKEIIMANGLSYSIKTTSDTANLTATCVVSHSAGHSEQSSFVVPLGTEAFMSEVQKFGARATFAKRYAFCDAFGIITGDKDNDGAVDNKQEVKEDDIKKAIAEFKKCLTKDSFLKVWKNIGKELRVNEEVIAVAKEIKNLIMENENQK
jgi:hypothetical protein